MTNTIFIIITIIITLTTKATKGDITCIAVSTPDDTIIMCSVGVDIPTTLDGINVQYYDSPGLPDGDTILMCNYKDSGDTICHQKSDIVYHEIIKENVIIKRKPHQHRGGQYKCQVVPPLGVAIIPCNITFIEVPTTKPQLIASQPPVTGYPAGGHGQGDKTQHTSDGVSVATFVLVLLVFILVFILVIAILYWKRQRIRQWWKAKRTRAPESTDVELEAESLTKEKDPKEDESSPAMTLEVDYYNKGWKDACSFGFADKSQILQDKSLLDPMKPDTEKKMPPKTASMLTGVYVPPVVREARLAMTREEWMEQQKQKQKQKMAKAERDKETREEKTQKMSDSPGEDASRTDPQDVEACVPLMEGGQETDGEWTTAPLTVDEARRQVRDAEAKVQETKKEMYKTRDTVYNKDNKYCEQVQIEAKEARKRFERANKELEEAKSALKTIKKAEKYKSKK